MPPDPAGEPRARSWDKTVDAFVARQVAAGLAFTTIESAPWILAFEAGLPHRLPPSYRLLVLRYAFEPFELAGIEFFGNTGAGARDDLVVAALNDPLLVQAGRRNGFIQVGRPSGGLYDPVCFDMNRRTKNGEAPLVQLDHEEMLIRDRIRMLHEYSKSFEQAIRELSPTENPI